MNTPSKRAISANNSFQHSAEGTSHPQPQSTLHRAISPSHEIQGAQQHLTREHWLVRGCQGCPFHCPPSGDRGRNRRARGLGPNSLARGHGSEADSALAWVAHRLSSPPRTFCHPLKVSQGLWGWRWVAEFILQGFLEVTWPVDREGVMS